MSQPWTDKAGGAKPPPSLDGAAVEDSRAPWVARSRANIMLDIEFQNGSRLALQYYDLAGVRLNGAGLLVLYFGQGTVTVKGRHLTELHEKLSLHQVVRIREQHVSALEQPESEPFIDRITLSASQIETLWQSPTLMRVGE
jgi:hypothetical protein